MIRSHISCVIDSSVLDYDISLCPFCKRHPLVRRRTAYDAKFNEAVVMWQVVCPCEKGGYPETFPTRTIEEAIDDWNHERIISGLDEEDDE